MKDRIGRLKVGRGQAGFTLIELLVVITILGILAAVVVFSVGGINNRGENAACQTDETTLRTAQEAYYAQNNKYADSATTLRTAGFLGSDATLHSTVATDGPDADTAAGDAYTITTTAAGTAAKCAPVT
jgi:prepilin-type N-terminal cleavage/methylation domain-containing protein